MSFLLTLAHFSLPNVKGMSRICKLCLGAKPQVSWIKTLKFYTIPVKMLRDFYRSTRSDVSKYRWYPSYEGRTLITAFDILLGNCTPPHWSEQSLWHTRSCQDFLLLRPQCNAYSLWKEENKKKKICKAALCSVCYTTWFLSSAFNTESYCNHISGQLYINIYIDKSVSHLYTIC